MPDWIVRELEQPSRKLIFYTPDEQVRLVLVKPSDVPTYVEYGIADAGIVGKDVLMEEGRSLYEMLDLKYGRCRIVVAGFPEKKRYMDYPCLYPGCHKIP